MQAQRSGRAPDGNKGSARFVVERPKKREFSLKRSGAIQGLVTAFWHEKTSIYACFGRLLCIVPFPISAGVGSHSFADVRSWRLLYNTRSRAS